MGHAHENLYPAWALIECEGMLRLLPERSTAMPIQTDPLDRPREAIPKRTPSDQEHFRTIQQRKKTSARENGASSGDADLREQKQPQQRRPTLVTLPMDHRYLRGRY